MVDLFSFVTQRWSAASMPASFAMPCDAEALAKAFELAQSREDLLREETGCGADGVVEMLHAATQRVALMHAFQAPPQKSDWQVGRDDEMTWSTIISVACSAMILYVHCSISI